MCEIEIFVSQPLEVLVFLSLFSAPLRHLVGVEHSSLPHEDRLNLKEIVAVMVYVMQRHV